jgi:DNA-3-methyladenine glycosylase
MNWKRSVIPKSFYDRNPKSVAQDLLGKFLVRKINGKFLVGMITETEAYLPSGDSAAHNFKGKTNGNKSLYKDAGHAYVHSMRQYCLLDIVTEGSDKPGSVLIRAVEPVEGIDVMKRLRKSDSIENLANGPGKVCMALGITRELDGINVTDPEGQIFLAREKENSAHSITTSPRIGISRAQNLHLRFHISENPHVSKK